ncbi:hypothetical protein HDV00_004734 [Rhizophlyctis rosea]|nr:hypothetical protein HDV00_004734 [Rhizophlyctis rosea]
MKRKRSSHASATAKGSSDRAVTAADEGRDLPRKFRRVLAYRKAKEHAPNKKQTKQKSVIPQRQAGETIGQYNRRVDDELRTAVNTAAQSESKTRQKKKSWLAERKLKAKSKKKAIDEDEIDLKDEVKFGTVAMQPPSISVVPKQRGHNAQAVKQLQAALLAAESKSTEAEEASAAPDRPAQARDVPDIGRKRKLKTLPQAERKALLNEREELIAKYRAMKSAKSGNG